MLYITAKKGNDVREFGWHIGNQPPLTPDFLVDKEVAVQADGDELLYVITNFKNIPFHVTKPVQIWIGDIAKFIAMHLE